MHRAAFPTFGFQTVNSGHASSPRVHSGPRTCRSSVAFPIPKGRAERLGETPRPRRPHCCGQPYAFRHTAPMRLSAHGQVQLISEPDRPQNTGVACVPHANGFFGLLHVPRNCRSRRHVPGSCELSPGHALGPSARLVGVNCLSVYGSPTSARNPQTFRPDRAAATASSSALW